MRLILEVRNFYLHLCEKFGSGFYFQQSSELLGGRKRILWKERTSNLCSFEVSKLNFVCVVCVVWLYLPNKCIKFWWPNFCKYKQKWRAIHSVSFTQKNGLALRSQDESLQEWGQREKLSVEGLCFQERQEWANLKMT